MSPQDSESSSPSDTQQIVEREFQGWLKSLPKQSLVGFLTLSEEDDPRRAAYAKALEDIENTCDELLARNGLNPSKFREQFYRDVVTRLAESIIDRRDWDSDTQDPLPDVYTGAHPSAEDSVEKPKKMRMRERRSGSERRKCVVFFEVERRKESRRVVKERRAGGAYAKK